MAKAKEVVDTKGQELAQKISALLEEYGYEMAVENISNIKLIAKGATTQS